MKKKVMSGVAVLLLMLGLLVGNVSPAFAIEERFLELFEDELLILKKYDAIVVENGDWILNVDRYDEELRNEMEELRNYMGLYDIEKGEWKYKKGMRKEVSKMGRRDMGLKRSKKGLVIKFIRLCNWFGGVVEKNNEIRCREVE